MNTKLLTGVILAVLTVIFIIQNTAVMELKFLFWRLSMSGALMAILVLSIGIILGWLMHGSFRRRKKRLS
ncbi:MAG: LapA family protein [Thermodesulfobacteriota bacterium]|nr:LapA family protein [Thermodesulfobacteriota bacterium]